MNKEEFIAQFREQVLPKYIELAQNEPYEVEKPVKYHSIPCKQCTVCGEVLPEVAFNKDDSMCRRCKNEKSLNTYYIKRIEKYKKMIAECEGKIR